MQLSQGIIILEKKDEKFPSFDRVGGISVLKRIVLLLGKMGIKDILIIDPDITIQAALRNEIHDKRIDQNIYFINENNVSEIKKIINDNFILITENIIFEMSILNTLTEINSINKPVLYTCYKEKDDIYMDGLNLLKVKSNGKPEIFFSGISILPKNFVEGYNQNTFSKSDVTNKISEIINSNNFETIPFDGKLYQTIFDKKSINHAEKKMFKLLRKSSDTLISRFINRPISLALTKYLMNTNITPNMWTTVNLGIGLIGAAFLIIGSALKEPFTYIFGILGGIFFNACSILDGCDGEIARIKLLSSKFGAWYDTFTDDLTNLVFVCCMGYYCSVTLKLQIYIVFVYILIFIFIIPKIIQNLSIIKSDNKDYSNFKLYFTDEQKEPDVLSVILRFLSQFARNDFLALMVMFMGIFNIYWLGFWFIFAFILGMSAIIIYQFIINLTKKVS